MMGKLRLVPVFPGFDPIPGVYLRGDFLFVFHILYGFGDLLWTFVEKISTIPVVPGAFTEIVDHFTGFHVKMRSIFLPSRLLIISIGFLMFAGCQSVQPQDPFYRSSPTIRPPETSSLARGVSNSQSSHSTVLLSGESSTPGQGSEFESVGVAPFDVSGTSPSTSSENPPYGNQGGTSGSSGGLPKGVVPYSVNPSVPSANNERSTPLNESKGVGEFGSTGSIRLSAAGSSDSVASGSVKTKTSGDLIEIPVTAYRTESGVKNTNDSFSTGSAGQNVGGGSVSQTSYITPSGSEDRPKEN